MAIRHDDLPDDVLTEILSRLPVKSLLRFLSVSKYWFSLIKNPNFISLHRNRAASIAKTAHTDSFLVKRCSDGHGSKLFRSFDSRKRPLPYNDFVLSLVPFETPVDDLDISFTGLNVRYLHLLDSSNGLILLSDSNSSTVLICNPAMREFRVLPQPPFETRRHTQLGFGFDPNSDDYKVVMVARLYESDIRSFNEIESRKEQFFARCGASQRIIDEKVLVYNLSTDCWRRVHNDVPIDLSLSCCTSLNGVIYWLGFEPRPRNWSIAAFRMSNEVFDVMPLRMPTELMVLVSKLFALKDSLTLVLLTTPYTRGTNSCVDIWVMDEFRITDSWTKKYSLGFGRRFECAFAFQQNGKFLVVGSGLEVQDDNEVVEGSECVFAKYRDVGSGLEVQDDNEVVEGSEARQMISYNLDTQIITKYPVYDDEAFGGPRHSTMQVIPYTECLISVK